MRNIIFGSIFFTFLLLSLSSTASEMDDQIRCLYSVPISKENIDVNVIECSYLHSFELFKLTDSLTFYPVLSLGAIITEHNNGSIFGGGGGFNYKINDKITAFIEEGLYYFSETEYGERGVAFVDYGVHEQFFTKIGIDYNFHKNWMIGYLYVHISNAGRDDENPSFDGHGLTLAYKF